MKNTERIFGLDILRAIAITTVVFYHSAPILSQLNYIPGIGRLIHSILALTEPLGILGVGLFFVLSGYLIGGILIRTYTNSDHYTIEEIKTFWVRRWFRTIPNYWFVLTVAIILYSLKGITTFDWTYIRYYLFVQNLWYKHPQFFPEAWSLAVEEWFYLSVPVILYLYSRIYKNITKQKVILKTVITYLATFLTIKIIFTSSIITNPLYFDWGVRKIVFFRLDAIAYGVLVAYLTKYHSDKLLKHKRSLLVLGITGLSILTAIHYVGIHPAIRLYQKSQGYRLFHNSFLITALSVSFAALIPYAANVARASNNLFGSFITFISKISYSMYLIHFTLILLPFWKPQYATVGNCIPIFILYWLLVFLFSWLLYKFIEEPGMRLRNKMTKAEG